MKQAIGWVLVLCGVASAGPQKFVDVTVTFKRMVTDTGSSSETSGACTTTTKTSIEYQEQVMVVASKVPLTDTADRLEFSLPVDKGKLTGQAHYSAKLASNTTTCNGKTDLAGTAAASADAKDVQVSFYFDKKPQTGSLTIDPDFGDPTATGKLTSEQKGQAAQTLDGGPMVAAQTGMIYTSAKSLTLDTQPTLVQLDKASPQLRAALTQFAQGKPLVVGTPGGAIDLAYSDEETTDLAKGQPQATNKKSSLVRKVSTEVSVHAAPSK